MTYSEIALSRVVACWGWWQGRNAGDNWIRTAMARTFGPVRLIDTDQQDFTGSEFVICGGGGLFTRGLPAPWNRPRVHVPHGVFAVGAETRCNAGEAARLARSSAFFHVRDRHTLRCLGMDDESLVCGDASFLFPVGRRAYSGGRRIAFVWRDPAYLAKFGYGDHMGATASREQWLAALRGAGTVVEPAFETDGWDVGAMLADCDIVVSARYHGVVCAMQAGLPFVAIDVLPKLRALTDEAGVPHCRLRLSEFEAVGKLIDDVAGSGRAETQREVVSFCDRSRKRVRAAAKRARDAIVERLADQPKANTVSVVKRLPERRPPLVFRFVPTMRCNLKCPYCFVEHGGGTMFDTAPAELWAQAMGRFGNHRVGFYMWGGEPFLPDGTFELVRRFCEYDFVEFARIDHNATKVPRILAECPSAKVKVLLSWHCHRFGLDEILESARGLKGADMLGMVNFVASPSNMEKLEAWGLSLPDLVRRFAAEDLFLNVAADFKLGDDPQYRNFILRYTTPEDWDYIHGRMPCEGERCEASRCLFTVAHDGAVTTCGRPGGCVGNFFAGRVDRQDGVCPRRDCRSLISYSLQGRNPWLVERHLQDYVARNTKHRERTGVAG